MADAIDAMRVAFTELSAGRVQMPERTTVPCGQDAVMLVMPGRCDVRFGLGAKIVSVFPDNVSRGKPTIHAMVVLLDETSGEPAAVLDGESLTAIRTGAASGLATDLLAPKDASVAAIIGAGAQARTQLEAVCTVRTIQRVVVCSRTRTSAERMVAEVRNRPWLGGADIEVVDAVSDAVRQADVVCTATDTRTPIVHDEDVRPGTHINAVGSFTPAMRELDPALIGSARVVVDYRPAALAEAGEIVAAIELGLLDPESLVEIGELADAPGERVADGRTTVFKSVGVAVQDLVAGSWIVTRDSR